MAMLGGMSEKTSKAKERLWRGRVRAWKSSGESAAGFAERQGFAASSLLYWNRRFRETGKVLVPTQSAKSKPEFAELVPRGTAPTGSVGGPGMVLELGGVSIRVTRPFDAALLKELVLALRGGAP